MSPVDLASALVHATARAAAAARRHAGGRDERAADRAATDALRAALNRIPFRGRIAIGEGLKDGAPGLFRGERVGSGWDDQAGTPDVDLAIDPIDGTKELMHGRGDAVVAMAAAPPRGLYSSRAFYLRQFGVSPNAAGGVRRREAPSTPARLVHAIACVRGIDPGRVRVAVLDRPRHERLIATLSGTGCEVVRVACDIPAMLLVALPDGGIDLTMGVSGVTECVIGAAAIHSTGGLFVASTWPPQPSPALHLAQRALVRRNPVLVVASGITDGRALPGVRRIAGWDRVTSLVIADGQVQSVMTDIAAEAPQQPE